MKLFEERFNLFFNDLVLQKYIDECLAKSIKALKVKNGNTPKWNEALNELNALSKGHLGLNEPYLSINNMMLHPKLLNQSYENSCHGEKALLSLMI